MREPKPCKRCCDSAFSFYCTNCEYAVPRETKHLTPEQLRAHEREIWEAAREGRQDDHSGDFEYDWRNYDDYKKSLKDG